MQGVKRGGGGGEGKNHTKKMWLLSGSSLELHRPQEGAKTKVGPDGWTGRGSHRQRTMFPNKHSTFWELTQQPGDTPAHGPSEIGALLPSGWHRAHLSGESLKAEECRMNSNFHIKWMA